MASLAEIIEKHLKALLVAQPQGVIELQRSDLAQFFSCVPSQINYVLTTRFTVETGYLVESRRGGGGYVRISRLPLESFGSVETIFHGLSRGVSQRQGESLLDRMFEEGFVTARECMLLKVAIARESLPLGVEERDIVRGSILKNVMVNLVKMRG